MSDLIKDIYGKTTIRFASENSAGQTLVTVYEPASKFSVGLYVPTAELLAALNAVPAEKLAFAERESEILREEHTEYEARARSAEAKLAFAESQSRQWAEKVDEQIAVIEELEADAESLAEVKAERDAHAATIERVWEAVAALGVEAEKARLAAIGQHDTAWSRLSGRQMALHDAAGRLEAALVPKPAFVLPTEAGAGVSAATSPGGVTDEFRLYSDGLWRGVNWDAPRTPEQFLKYFTDHRLLDGAE